MKTTILKITRKEKGLTQSEIAKKAKISILSYQRYESGERVPNAYIAQLIAQALKTTVEELFLMLGYIAQLIAQALKTTVEELFPLPRKEQKNDFKHI